nr:Bardet-Biedl syndrome 12 protein [Misgurnus anguillicaudatus]XP_055034096.1 Bardet-Biedl syndrome 12 protein [Misgurnus anguillicaudatus]XP_055034097.1 Bardet-Biedl syndrome 12 protein [Misgurnus anguillicaudatus]XP_055034098.1 Bardet-Biedl syndrome 12 protein [Misgurnus anguillicaudatus]XP_055034099.1 Bardet-Biedl syndrome 12 protein [Misgurnus anguillicaudatus]XP_055034100.1 Bardet-Biedl syndrome 12 protein [Misgurnus anguillicaudatus]XP_055034101.1 Bardet-Biedl syndrome 12 protein [Misg
MSRASVASIGQHHHIALQQLEAIATTSHSFLGPNKRQKFIQDEDEGSAVLVSSCVRLLENMELQCSVGQLLNETVRSQHKILNSGTNSLVFLAGIWSRVALDCLHRGMTVLDIKTGMTKGLEVCLEACMQSAVCLKEVSSREKPSNTPSDSQGNLVRERFLGVHDTTMPKENVRSTMKHSRHFSSQYEEAMKSFDMSHVAQAVSHGCEASMNLVLEACKLQGNVTDKCWNGALDVQKLVTCPVSGLSEKHSQVLHGYVVLISDEQSLVVQHLQEKTLNIALVNGDLSEKYRHVGFNRPARVTHIADHANLTCVSREEHWIQSALKTLCGLSVNILLVSGVVSIKLKDHCITSNILIIERARSDILKDFSMSTGAVLVSYITQLNERYVGRGVKVSRWREFGRDGSTAISITTAGTSLVTAVITSSVPAELQSLEDRFWSCAHRLNQALADGKLLKGAAATELLCIWQLYKSTQTEMENPHEKVVMQLMADGWMDYISTLMLNCGTVSSKAEAWTAIAHQLRLCEDGEPMSVEVLWAPVERQTFGDFIRNQNEVEVETDVSAAVYDNVTVKFEAWRRALDLVLLVLQSDTEIITGVNERENVSKEFMYL